MRADFRWFCPLQSSQKDPIGAVRTNPGPGAGSTHADPGSPNRTVPKASCVGLSSSWFLLQSLKNPEPKAAIIRRFRWQSGSLGHGSSCSSVSMSPAAPQVQQHRRSGRCRRWRPPSLCSERGRHRRPAGPSVRVWTGNEPPDPVRPRRKTWKLEQNRSC